MKKIIICLFFVQATINAMYLSDAITMFESASRDRQQKPKRIPMLSADKIETYIYEHKHNKFREIIEQRPFLIFEAYGKNSQRVLPLCAIDARCLASLKIMCHASIYRKYDPLIAARCKCFAHNNAHYSLFNRAIELFPDALPVLLNAFSNAPAQTDPAITEIKKAHFAQALVSWVEQFNSLKSLTPAQKAISQANLTSSSFYLVEYALANDLISCSKGIEALDYYQDLLTRALICQILEKRSSFKNNYLLLPPHELIPLIRNYIVGFEPHPHIDCQTQQKAAAQVSICKE